MEATGSRKGMEEEVNGMNTEVDKHKTAFIKERIAELRKANPRLTFREAWTAVQREHPELFRSALDSSYAPDPGGEPKRGWHEPPQLPSADQLQSKVSAGDWLDLYQVCKTMKIPVRVEASRGDATDALELSDTHGRLLREWVELQGSRKLE